MRLLAPLRGWQRGVAAMARIETLAVSATDKRVD